MFLTTRSRKHLLIGFFCVFLLGFKTMGQIPGADFQQSIKIEKTTESIKVDGVLNESIWDKKDKPAEFWQYFPFDTAQAVSQTMVWMAFDEKYIFLAAKLVDDNKGKYFSQSLRRDYLGDNQDAFTVVLDPFQDKTNGFFFGVNPYGVQREGLISNGGALLADFDLSWDNKWISGVHRGDGYWSIEMAIPFKTLRFNSKAKIWGINFYRVDSKINERSVWSRVPREFEMFNLTFTGNLIFDSLPVKPGANISIIPFTAVNVSKNHLEGGKQKQNVTYGGDLKVAVTPSLNLDATINPDFSQVEVDQQQTNLDRFELFFPERRQFFLENADLFSNFGFDNARPFFSRRIGVAIDSSTGQTVQDRIIAGARLSGRLDENWRIGLLNMQTERNQSLNLSGSNFITAAVQRKVFKRSNISALFVNKQNSGGSPVDPQHPENGSYNRLFGLEYNMASANGKWTGKSFYHRTISAGNNHDAFSHGTYLNFSTLKFFASWTHQIVGNGFDSKVGFVPRVGFNRVNPVLGFYVYRNSHLINRFRFSLSNNWTWNHTWGVTDYNFSTAFSVDFQNTAVYNFSLLSNYVKLFLPFNPTGNSNRLFLPGRSFSQTGFLTSFQTDQRKPFFTYIQIISGRFYNGNLRQLSGNIDYRYKQYSTFALAYNISNINLADGFGGTTFFLIGPRVDLTMTKNLFWTTYIQYNSQFDNINFNSRFQWRFKPVSDLFVVYTDNYFPENFKTKNRALVLKFSYWLNL